MSLYQNISQAFNKAFVDQISGKIIGETQTCYAIALAFELLPEKLRPEQGPKGNLVLNDHEGMSQMTSRSLARFALWGSLLMLFMSDSVCKNKTQAQLETSALMKHASSLRHNCVRMLTTKTLRACVARRQEETCFMKAGKARRFHEPDPVCKWMAMCTAWQLALSHVPEALSLQSMPLKVHSVGSQGSTYFQYKSQARFHSST